MQLDFLRFQGVSRDCQTIYVYVTHLTLRICKNICQVWSSWDENQHLKSHGSWPKNGVLPLPGQGITSASSGVLWRNNRVWDWEVDQGSSCDNAAITLVRHGKEGAELKGEALDLVINLYVPPFTYGHDLWITIKTNNKKKDRNRQPFPPARCSSQGKWEVEDGWMDGSNLLFQAVLPKGQTTIYAHIHCLKCFKTHQGMRRTSKLHTKETLAPGEFKPGTLSLWGNSAIHTCYLCKDIHLFKGIPKVTLYHIHIHQL